MITRTPNCHCLGCGHPFSALGDLDDPKGRAPQAGDVTICVKCGAVMKLDAELKVRGMSDEEMDELTADTEAMNHLAKIVRTVHMIRAMRQ